MHFFCQLFNSTPQTVTQEDYLPTIEIEEEIEEKRCFGISWKDLTSIKCRDYFRFGIGAISVIAMPVLSYCCYKDFSINGLNVKRAAGFGAGIGLFATTLGITLKATKTLDAAARWSYETQQFIEQLYGNNGFPRGNLRWERTDAVKQGFSALFAGFCIAILTISANNILQGESLLPDIEAAQIQNIMENGLEQAPLVPERAFNLMLESIPSETKNFIFEQILKALVGIGAITAYNTVPLLTAFSEIEFLGGFLVASSVTSLFAKVWLWQEPNILKKIARSQAKSIFEKAQKTAALASNIAISGAFVWRDVVGFLIMGALSGWSKTISIDTFSQLDKRQIPEEDVLQPLKDLIQKEGKEKITPIIRLVALILTICWYAYGLSDPKETTANKIKVLFYFSSAFTGYVLTRYTGKTFTPKQNSKIINSLYFYLIHFQGLNVLPYSIIRATRSITNHDPDNIADELLSYLAFLLLGFPVGANRALHGLTENRSPADPGALSEEFTSTLFLYLASGLIA